MEFSKATELHGKRYLDGWVISDLLRTGLCWNVKERKLSHTDYTVFTTNKEAFDETKKEYFPQGNFTILWTRVIRTIEQDSDKDLEPKAVEEPFKNGDKVRYAGGLVFTFIGINPSNTREAFCITKGYNRNKDILSSLPINKLRKHESN